MALLRILLLVVVAGIGLQRAERMVVERSMLSLQPPFRPHPMRWMGIIPPPIPPPPPPPSPGEVPGAT